MLDSVNRNVVQLFMMFYQWKFAGFNSFPPINLSLFSPLVMLESYIQDHELEMHVVTEWRLLFMIIVSQLVWVKLLLTEFGMPVRKPLMNYPNQPWGSGVSMDIVRDIEQAL
jgi:hypothetical protein